MNNCSRPWPIRISNEYFRLSVFVAALCMLVSARAQAETIIKQPGNHPLYAADVEPHLALGLDDTPYYGGGGFGLGARVTIPFLRNGAVSTINNDMGIGFGLDWLSRGSSCYHDYYYVGGPYAYNDCSAWAVYLPVVLQWNFYITDIITVFGEPGFAIRYAHVSGTWLGPARNCPAGVYCEFSDSFTDPLLVFAGGAKFMFGRTVGLNVRLGYPYFSVGASILL
jgi:hypothetical protein